MFSNKNRRYLLLILVIGVFLSLSFKSFISAKRAKDIAEIERVVKVASRILYQDYVLPQVYRDNPDLPVPKSVVEKAKEHFKEELAKYYDVNSFIYKLRLQQYSDALDAVATTKERSLGGGIRKVEKFDVSFNLAGDTAKAEMIAIVWSKFRDEEGRVFTPEGKIKYNFELKKIDGSWKITAEEFTFPEGI